MNRKVTAYGALALSLIMATSAGGQAANALGTLVRGKSVLDFYEAAIANPSEVITLASEIRKAFKLSPSRYEGLSNNFAQQAGWFQSGPLGLEHIELRPEPSSGHPFGHFSITIKKLSFEQCELLIGNSGVNANFVSVALNGEEVSPRDVHLSHEPQCKKQRLFQDGENAIKYVGY